MKKISFCPNCGAELPQPVFSNGGKVIVKYCPDCGYHLEPLLIKFIDEKMKETLKVELRGPIEVSKGVVEQAPMVPMVSAPEVEGDLEKLQKLSLFKRVAMMFYKPKTVGLALPGTSFASSLATMIFSHVICIIVLTAFILLGFSAIFSVLPLPRGMSPNLFLSSLFMIMLAIAIPIYLVVVIVLSLILNLFLTIAGRIATRGMLKSYIEYYKIFAHAEVPPTILTGISLPLLFTPFGIFIVLGLRIYNLILIYKLLSSQVKETQAAATVGIYVALTIAVTMIFMLLFSAALTSIIPFPPTGGFTPPMAA